MRQELSQLESQRICALAHGDAADCIPTGVFASCNALDVARGMASSRDLTGFAADLYVERFVGHVINVETSGRGV